MVDNEFGYTAWGMDWVRLAQPLRQSGPARLLLPRARSLARNNLVKATVEGRIVRASIHRGGQASVTQLEVAPLTRASITGIAAIVPDTAVLTDDIHQDIVTAGIALAPVLADTDCSCSARSAPCLHLLAVLYEIAHRVDENPQLALDIQGYTTAMLHDSAVPASTARWTPVSALDPAAFFERASG
ncbi:SWIM zinc finger family protein [Rhodococcus sp. W8901]|uniref:SWIM zinc finger family protein n=1 Tax=Rhodococcus sp. W8901 TaxID=2742603 RepID=UPI0015842DE8|nr:SWIM zinc finger family protein [Rhodococcus sp. W8901]QKT09835.1 SWIM zinc finger family protein [Rhodococcus sp. W8901]